MFHLLGTLLMGLVVGIAAKFLLPGRDGGGMIMTIIVGIAGSFLGGFIGRSLGMYGPGDAAGWLMSIGGAILLLLGYRMIAGQTT